MPKKISETESRLWVDQKREKVLIHVEQISGVKHRCFEVFGNGRQASDTFAFSRNGKSSADEENAMLCAANLIS